LLKVVIRGARLYPENRKPGPMKEGTFAGTKERSVGENVGKQRGGQN
jgi:hypothetical protein